MIIKLLLLTVVGFLLVILWRGRQNSSSRRQRVAMGVSARNNLENTDMAVQTDQVIAQEQLEAVPADFFNFHVLGINDLVSEQKAEVIKMTSCFRKPHPLLMPLVQSGFEPNELFELVKTDPEMTAKILKEVNSPLYSLTQSISSINHAINFIGVNQVKNIALMMCVQNVNDFKDKAQNDAYKKLWSASQIASAICNLVAKNLGEKNVGDLSTCCLLSYLGDHAILAYQPQIAGHYLAGQSLYQRLESIQRELGVNAAIVGEKMIQQWRLPEVISQGISNSLLPLTNVMAKNALTKEQFRHTVLCYIACRIADFVAFQGVRDIATIGRLDREHIGSVDFYYIQECIEQAGLHRIHDILSDHTFQQQANKIITQLARG